MLIPTAGVMDGVWSAPHLVSFTIGAVCINQLAGFPLCVFQSVCGAPGGWAISAQITHRSSVKPTMSTHVDHTPDQTLDQALDQWPI